ISSKTLFVVFYPVHALALLWKRGIGQNPSALHPELRYASFSAQGGQNTFLSALPPNWGDFTNFSFQVQYDKCFLGCLVGWDCGKVVCGAPAESFVLIHSEIFDYG
ncbi:MAG: hypothetical protein Q4D38_13175, partial [Planctomycetia bacterium]|nr:hypothetical protein [Planctomycetia bacterium]